MLPRIARFDFVITFAVHVMQEISLSFSGDKCYNKIILISSPLSYKESLYKRNFAALYRYFYFYSKFF